MATIIRLSFTVLALAACAGAALFVYISLGNAFSVARLLPLGWDSPVSSTPRRETVTIHAGQSAAAIGEELQQRGLIRSALAFRWEVQSRGIGAKLGAGDYELSPNMSMSEIVAVLARGSTAPGTTLTVLEGWRSEQVAARVEELGLGPAEALLNIVRSPREHGLMPPDPEVSSLEGYLFPDTYELEPTAAPQQITETMLRQFNQRFGQQLRGQASARGLTVNQAATLASIIEREAAQPSERPLISSVYHNRLSAGMKLEADPTVQYAIANLDLRTARGYGFWKRDLTLEDLKADSPFNTYQYSGLPPGPICSPGLDALQAAVAPAQTRFLFFVAKGDGSHAFAETQQEHEANVLKFR